MHEIGTEQPGAPRDGAKNATSLQRRKQRTLLVILVITFVSDHCFRDNKALMTSTAY